MAASKVSVTLIGVCFMIGQALGLGPVFVNHKMNAANLVSNLSTDNVVANVAFMKGEGKEEVIFASSYCPYEQIDPRSSEVKMLIGVCSSKNLKFILGCDSNSHHVIWARKDCNNRGNVL